MQQIVDLQNSPGFQALDVPLVSISFDNQSEQAAGVLEYGIKSVPMLIVSDDSVSRAYDVL